MKKNKSFLLLVCLIFMLNSFTFNVYALNSGTSSRAIGNVNIISTVDTSLERVEAWARSKNATETFVGLAKLYKKYAELRGGVNWVVAYVQAAKETGYGKFGGVLDESYHNPCGLKNPEAGDDYDAGAHKKFDNWEQGVLAHLDHLALYAAADGFPKTSYLKNWKDEPLAENETYDPRHVGWFGTTGGILGKAKDVLGLTGSWASDPNYGIELFRLYCDATNSEYLPAKSNLESPSNSEVITNGKLRIKGWALHAFGIKEIKVLVDKSQVATISTGLSRPDVNSTYPGYFNGDVSGFDQTIDISGLGTGDKTVEVIIVARNGETQSYKRNIVIKEQNVNLPKLNNLEEPSNNKIITNGKLTIKGWALDQSGVKEVRVSVDGKDFGNVNYGTTRTDVNKVYPGYPSGNNAGFEGTIDISNLTSGNKKVVVQITSNDGSIQKIERTIKVEKLESKSWLDNPNNNSISSGTLKVSGWALASSGVKEVRVYVDGKDLGTVNYGTTRTDVNNAYPGYPSGNNAGFEGTVNLGGMATGDKKLKVKITANDGTTQTIERNFVYRKAKLVVVDPGHEIESVDPGASATHNGIRYVEGNLNLQIAVKLKAQLEAMGIEVYMTRYDGLIIDKDSTESLKKRVKVANEMDADLFVSIHHNSYTSPSANGFEVYYSTGTPVSDNMIARSLITEDGRDLTLERKSYRTRNIEEKVKVSKELATVITNTASTELGLYNRGAKDSNLYVCKNTLMPSILIENGFITNPTEATKVSKDSHQQKLAEITAQKINEALK